MMERSTEGKGVVVITGASAGVGRACARLFAERGYDVSLIARGEEGLKGAQAEVEALGRKAIIHLVDVADADSVERAAHRTEQELGPIDVWVNNAMNSVFSPVKQMTAEDYRRVTEVTYLGQVHGALSALRRMLPRDRGKIVFVGSALAYRGIPLQSAYCGAKHAIQGFCDSLRTELMHDRSGVSITEVHLPALNTTQFKFVKSRLPNKPRPMGTIFQPEVAADAIVFAAEHDRRDIFVGYPTYEAIIGNKIAPWYADRVLANTGIEGQQTDEPEEADRPHNLWEPLPGDHGAHGNFGDQAKPQSFMWWLSRNRRNVGITALALAGSALIGGALASRNRRELYR